MNCPKCGQPVEPGAAFCGNCGQALQAAPPTVQPAVIGQGQQNPAAQTQTQTQTQPQPQSAVAGQVPESGGQTTQPAAQNALPQQPTVGAATETGLPAGAALPGQPNASVMGQVLANQPATPSPVVSNFGGPVMGAAINAGGAMPAYATGVNPNEHAGETKAVVGLILGIIGIPAALIPLIGLALGIAGLILGTIARSHYKRTLSMLAIIFSSLAILVSLGSWVYFAAHVLQQQKTGSGSSATSTSSSSLSVISTPCYSVRIDQSLGKSAPSGCNFDAVGTSQEYVAEGVTNSNVTPDNLSQVGQAALAKAASSLGGTITDGQMGQFAGSPAYIAHMNLASENVNGIYAVVLHATSGGNNVFITGHAVKNGQQVSFGLLESNWHWK